MHLDNIKELAFKVNTYWQKEHPEFGTGGWQKSCYLLGNLAAYELTKEENFLDYAIRWAKDKNWSFFRDEEHTTVHADCILCGQTFISIMDMVPGLGTYENMTKTLNFQLEDERCDYWWWIDAIHMALPLYHQMAVKCSEPRYYEKARKLYLNTRDDRKLYDKEDHLWYRDENYLPENKREENGEKIYWGRGNGWVFAGIARALDAMGKENPYYEDYAKDLMDMAESLKKVQNDDGSYCVSFLDKETYPYHESSATVLIVLGYLIGLRLGILEEKYRETAMKGANWLIETALNEEGRIGWCQDVAGWPSHDVSEDLSKDYIVGIFLLVLKELAEIC